MSTAEKIDKTFFKLHPYPTGLGVWFRGYNWREGRTGGRDGCDGNYEVGAYGMEWVHNREPERSRIPS